jgi:hypothetical protein
MYKLKLFVNDHIRVKYRKIWDIKRCLCNFFGLNMSFEVYYKVLIGGK